MTSWVLRLSAIALLLVLSIVPAPGRVHACVCGAPPTVAEALENADTVFAGRVVSEGPVVEFLVSRVWKGEPLETIFLDDSSETGWVVKLAQSVRLHVWSGRSA